jgi:hypothetical protein
MNRILYYILTCLCLGLALNLNAQQFKAFTEEPQTYLDEMKNLFSKAETNYDEGKVLLEQFSPYWLTGFSTDKQRRVYQVSNLLLNRKARNFPQFYDYINTLVAFSQSNIDSVNYNEWEKGLILLLSDKKSKLNDIDKYVVSTIYLLKENIVYYSSTIKWMASNNHYKIKVENDSIKFIFDKIDLKCTMREDSITINKTSGTYYPISSRWDGNNAIVLWEKAGISRDTAWAEIDSYSFPMNKASYTIEKVRFYQKHFFDKPLIGTLTDKIVETAGRTEISYPQFVSDEKTFKINGIFQDIDYKGGFSMLGSKFVGSGTKDNYATLSIYRDVEYIKDGDTLIKKQLFIRTYSLYYALRKNSIVARNAKISIYIDKDSIYHPGLQLKYYNPDREITLIRDKDPENMSRCLYYDSYHKMEMDFELLRWRLGEQNVDITNMTGSALSTAKFESENYFSAQRYYEVQGLEENHPYSQLRAFVKSYGLDEFYAEDFSRFLKMGITTTRRLLIDLAYRGIVDYDFETEYCKVKPKLYQYLESIVGRRDYDLINFESQTGAGLSNAVLNLKNMDLAIEGVPVVNVSDSQNVIFYPSNQRILVKKNRNFDFSGRIEAGLFTFYGENFQFKYDSFKIALNRVDSLSIKVKSGVDAYGRRKLANVQNVIESITGDLVIDDPGNKSGVKRFSKYPVFESKKNSFVYYDDKHIQKGKYKRDRFYFMVYPYVIDSLNNFSTEGMGYAGELHSSDIFPVIYQNLLVLQEDNSLGFHTNTPKDGYPAFKGKGQYYNDIWLSNQGLRGNGYLKYITSKTTSDDFVFYPDSMNTTTTAFNIEKRVNIYPDVNALKIYVHWMPYQDNLLAKTIEKPMEMYGQKAMHSGQLVYTPQSLTGSGYSNYYDAKLSSDGFKFFANDYRCDTANFEINSFNEGMLALLTTNVNAKVNFTDNTTNLRSNTGTSQADLPENLYTAWIEQITWKMLTKNIQLSSPNTMQVLERGKNKIITRQEAGLASKGSLFLSVHKGQDSLNWISPVADFDLKTNIVSAHEVKYIEVADANIFPDKGEVTVLPLAQLKTLTNAELLANTDTKYHRFKKATINISSRKLYYGQGDYTYSEDNGQEERIAFDPITVDSTGQTFADGQIKSIEDFSLSPAFKFQGRVHLEARNPLLLYHGAVKINHECNQLAESWVNFESEIDPKNIYIPINEQPMEINGSFLTNGVMMATDSVHIYPSFLSPRKLYSNIPVATSQGYLYYDKGGKKYELGSKERIASDDSTGNYLSLQKNECTLYSDGYIDLAATLGRMKIETRGNSIYNLANDRYTMDLIMTLNYYLPDGCFKLLSDTLLTMTGLPAISLKSNTYVKGIKELLGSKAGYNYLKEQAIFGTVKNLPDELKTTFVFSELNMFWNKNADAWQSIGEIGLVNVYGQQINKKVKGMMEIERKRSGDGFSLYLEITPNLWYFFNYKRGLMQAYSSDAKFNNVIVAIKGNDRKLEAKRGEASYLFFLSDISKRNNFIKHMNGEKVAEENEGNAPEGEDNGEYKKYEEN